MHVERTGPASVLLNVALLAVSIRQTDSQPKMNNIEKLRNS
ncbi:hypothetical protein CPter91_4107 [Collimonas pratensis]|uniref:Uncharacterized protein n=1 Tax=Collimonas pratensis TaxID=279113 RepID=A0A127Q990_9BURK|nr:hypothetical protein CPter91_4107 [Collimonas pratensis]